MQGTGDGKAAGDLSLSSNLSLVNRYCVYKSVTLFCVATSEENMSSYMGPMIDLEQSTGAEFSKSCVSLGQLKTLGILSICV